MVMATATDGAIHITDGAILGIIQAGVIRATIQVTVMDIITTLIIMEEEDLQLITDPEDILQEAHITALAEVMPEEETILLTEADTLLIDVQTTQTLEEVQVQMEETTQARLSQTEEVQHKDKAIVMTTEDLARLQTEVTTTPIVTRQDHTLLAHLAQ